MLGQASGVGTIVALVHFLGRKINIHNLLHFQRDHMQQAMKGGQSLLGMTKIRYPRCSTVFHIN